MNAALERLREWTQAEAPTARPRIAVVLGSGWGALVRRLDDARCIPYAELPGFAAAGVPGHAGELWLGHLGAHQVAVLSGRRHAYEDGDAAAMDVPLRTLRAWGCELLVLTNAAGSVHAHMPPGSLMLLSDHLNLVQRSPLVGHTGPERFVDMARAYDPELRAVARAVAEKRGETLHEGVYAWFLGPQFETPAEIRMAKLLGADAVGMSTVNETIIARHAGMRVLALSLITNLAR
jgi:purine-nucleoside phosphorylase